MTVPGRIAVILLFAQTLLSGCEKPPTDAIIRAERLIENARTLQADTYAPETLLRAEEAIKTAREYVVSRKYQKAKESAEEAARFAQEAAAIARAEKIRLRGESERMAQEISIMLKELQEYSSGAAGGSGKGPSGELHMLIDTYQADLSAGEKKIQEGRLGEACQDLTMLKDQVTRTKELYLTIKMQGGTSWK